MTVALPLLLAAGALLKPASAQLPADPEGLERIRTRGAQVRVKEATGVCETTEGVKSYAGYVDLPRDVHMHFWLFEARNNKETASTTILIPGGPVGDSTSAAMRKKGRRANDLLLKI